MGLKTDATLLDIRLKAAGLPVVGVSFDGETPVVKLRKTATAEEKTKLAELLASHDDAAAEAVKTDIEEDQPFTRRQAKALVRELRAEIQLLRDQIKGATNG